MSKKGSKRQPSVVDSAVSAGIQELTKRHAGVNANYIGHHIDHGALENVLSDVNSYIAQKEHEQKRPLSEEQKAKLFYNQIASNTASGYLLDDKAKKLILLKAKQSRSGKPDELDSIIEAFSEVQAIMPEGVAKNNPQLAQAVNTIYEARFYRAMADILAAEGILNQGEYQRLNQEMPYTVKQRAQEAVSHLSKYLKQPKKVAASFIGLAGITIVLLFGASITGNSVGISNAASGILAGAFLIIAGALMLKE